MMHLVNCTRYQLARLKLLGDIELQGVEIAGRIENFVIDTQAAVSRIELNLTPVQKKIVKSHEPTVDEVKELQNSIDSFSDGKLLLSVLLGTIRNALALVRTMEKDESGKAEKLNCWNAA